MNYSRTLFSKNVYIMANIFISPWPKTWSIRPNQEFITTQTQNWPPTIILWLNWIWADIRSIGTVLLVSMDFEPLSSSVDDLEDLRTITSGSPLFADLGLTRTFISGGTKTFWLFFERNEDLTRRKKVFLWMILLERILTILFFNITLVIKPD